MVGKLQKVDLRTVWENEATDFTPWLLQNSDYLSEVIGIDLELSASEHGVGPYSVDLIGRDASNDCVVIIENQIENTDHKHLGQLITYAANTDATVIIWIAKKFTDEHRQAIDYLNSLSGESNKGRFYGVEVSAVRIGDSQPAAQFEVIARPNTAKTPLKSPNSIRRWANLPGLQEFPRYLQTNAVFLDALHLTNH